MSHFRITIVIIYGAADYYDGLAAIMKNDCGRFFFTKVIYYYDGLAAMEKKIAASLFLTK